MSALAAVVRVTLLRLVRGRTLWIAAVIAVLPVVFAAIVQHQRRALHFTFQIELLVLSVLPPLVVAAPIGEEIEGGTATYLWSRSLARETVLLGKLLALAPFAIAYIVASWLAAHAIVTGDAPSLDSLLGVGASALAVSLMVCGIAVLVPRHAMALTIVYLGIDYAIGQIPASIEMLSVTHQASKIGEGAAIATAPVVAITVLAIGWLVVGLRRIRRLEL